MPLASDRHPEVLFRNSRQPVLLNPQARLAVRIPGRIWKNYLLLYITAFSSLLYMGEGQEEHGSSWEAFVGILRVALF